MNGTASLIPIFELHVQHEGELPSVVESVNAAVSKPVKLGLYGDLGAGKTAFSKAFCTALGVVEKPASPTFSIINQYAYEDSDGREQPVYHIDLYRLKRVEEALDLGLEDLFLEEVVFLVEWPQIAEGLLPDDFYALHIELSPDGGRIFRLFKNTHTT